MAGSVQALPHTLARQVIDGIATAEGEPFGDSSSDTIWDDIGNVTDTRPTAKPDDSTVHIIVRPTFSSTTIQNYWAKPPWAGWRELIVDVRRYP